MWVIYDKTVTTPDIEATSANLRRRFTKVNVSRGMPELLHQELLRVKADPGVLERGSIARSEDVGLVNLNPGEQQNGSIQFLDAEIFFESPLESFDFWELCNFVSQSLVMSEVAVKTQG